MDRVGSNREEQGLASFMGLRVGQKNALRIMAGNALDLKEDCSIW